jgi:hypothetical protein
MTALQPINSDWTKEITMTRETLTDTLLPTTGLITIFFFYRKVYYHFKFLALHYPKLKDKSILNLLFSPMTLLEHFYVIIPIFIKSDRKKEEEELNLETKIVNSTRMFWIMFGLIIVMGLILNWDHFQSDGSYQ